MHIPASTSFAKYLGIPLITHKPRAADYKELLVRFNKRLAGWQTTFIKFAGWVALIKSVLSSLPVYHMQTTLLPRRTIQDMEQTMRWFL